MPRPKIRIELKTSDRFMEALSVTFLILMIIIISFYFNKLPETIPTHFDASGKPDGYGSKTSFLIFPVIGILLYSGLTIISRFPHIFNYPVSITDENAHRQYSLALSLIRFIKLTIVMLFTVITYSSVTTALGEYNGLGAWFIPTSIFLLLGSIGYYFYRAIKAK